MKIVLGIQTNWPSGICHGCRRKWEFPNEHRDLTWPFLTLIDVRAGENDRGPLVTLVLCSFCAQAIAAAFEQNRQLIAPLPPPPEGMP